MTEKKYYVYICTNYPRCTVLYTGITSKLITRGSKHKNKFYNNSFTCRYNVNRVVYYELYGDVHVAIDREKQIKGYKRIKKINLIKKFNPKWEDVIDDSFLI